MDEIYVDPTATSSEVIQVGGKCYILAGSCNFTPNTFADNIQNEFDDCEECACGCLSDLAITIALGTYCTGCWSWVGPPGSVSQSGTINGIYCIDYPSSIEVSSYSFTVDAYAGNEFTESDCDGEETTVNGFVIVFFPNEDGTFNIIIQSGGADIHLFSATNVSLSSSPGSTVTVPNELTACASNLPAIPPYGMAYGGSLVIQAC